MKSNSHIIFVLLVNRILLQQYAVQQVLSNPFYPDGSPVFHEAILGNYVNETMTTNGTKEVWAIVSAQSIIMKIDIPDLGVATDKLEEKLLDRLAGLQSMWKDTSVKFEYFTFHAYQNEFQRAMNQDLPLVVVLVVVMMSFTCLVFYRRKDKVQSRALLGVFSFATIGMSLLTGYGLMFLIGVPLTSVGIMIPFVVVGVALGELEPLRLALVEIFLPYSTQLNSSSHFPFHGKMTRSSLPEPTFGGNVSMQQIRSGSKETRLPFKLFKRQWTR